MDSNQRQAQDLLDQIERQIQLYKSSVRLANRDFTWYRVQDPDQLLEAAVASDSDAPPEELDPFWAATWRAAIGLDRFLERIDIAGQRILELGCGSGQAGVGAAARGALVTMTDTVELALLVARLNAVPVSPNVETRRLKWGAETLELPRFPIIIGSDLVYDPNLFPLLDRCARDHITADGAMYLSEPHRHTGEKFASWVVEAGWKMQEHQVDLQDERIPIRIFECRL